jgi:hypothetical protein
MQQWYWLLNPVHAYHRLAPVPASAATATMLGVLALAAVLLLAARWVRTRVHVPLVHELMKAVFLVAVLVALNAARQQTTWLAFEPVETRVGRTATVALVVLALGACVLGLVRARRRAVSAAVLLTLWLLPFAAFTFGSALLQIARNSRDAPLYAPPAPAAFVKRSAPPNRLVVVVFDNLGQGDVFPAQPGADPQPAFESLRASSVELTNAYPPSFSTSLSISSMTTGRPVVDARFAGPRDLEIQFDSEAGTHSWAEVENLFAQARADGVNSAAVGWFHPYCRLFGASLVSCYFRPDVPVPDYSWSAELRRLRASLVDGVPGARRLDLTDRLGWQDIVTDLREWHLGTYEAVQDEAVRAVADSRYDLVFVHHSVPHDPYVYDREHGRFDTVGPSSHLDNVVLAGVALQSLCAALERAGLWDSSTLVVTADHWNRNQDDALARSRFPVVGHEAHRVPFLVKLPGQTSPLASSAVFLTYHLRDLALGVLRGELRTPESLVSWIARKS